MFRPKELFEDISNESRQLKTAVLTMSLGLVAMGTGAGLEMADGVEINGHHIVDAGFGEIGALATISPIIM